MQHHICLSARPLICSICGLPYPQKEYCTTCGMDISPAHICQPGPIPHYCHPPRYRGQCPICNTALPIPTYCSSCGADISEPHICINNQYPFFISRPVIVNYHRCFNLPRLSTCHSCGMPLPSPSYCTICGMDISQLHICIANSTFHICLPMHLDSRCLFCGEYLPTPVYCSRCGMDISERHTCKNIFSGW
jgi:hypothetical protein